MKFDQRHLHAIATALLTPVAVTPMTAQTHRVGAPEQVTRAVAVYEYVGDLQHPKAARLIPVSLFIGGHFEDAGVYLARPIPFALDTGLRYELQRAGVRQDFFDVVASRHFTNSTVVTAEPFDDGWFGYGRVALLPTPKSAKLSPSCGNGHVVQETDAAKKDVGKPHFGSRSTSEDEQQAPSARGRRGAAPDPCREEPEQPERVSLADDSRKDRDSPDPERPTLHRSPATTANNTGAEGKPDKKAPKPPPATISANGGPADDPDRPTIRHRTTDENDPNALPPDPLDLASRERSPATARGEVDAKPASAAPISANDTVAEGGSITGGDTMSRGPVLRRGRLTAPPAEPVIAAGKPVATPASAPLPAANLARAISGPLDAMVAVSDAKERVPHDFTYHFTSPTERAAALGTLQGMALAVLANPALASDAPEVSMGRPVLVKPVPSPSSAAAGVRSSTATRVPTRSGTSVRARSRTPAATTTMPPALANEEMTAFQLYFSAPVTYAYTARMPATGTMPERFVTVIAQTDAEGKLQPAMRSVTDAAHLNGTPRYRLIDVVDADGSNRGSLLMELRAQHTRQFALYRLLGNKPDQVFLSGTTLL